MQKYPKLFSSLTIGGKINLSNRYVMAPMYLNLESELDPKNKKTRDDFKQAMSTFYATRAAENLDLIIVGGISPSYLGKWKRKALSLVNYDMASALSDVTSAIHKEHGKCLLQCFHAGRSAFNVVYVAPDGAKSKVHPYPEVRPIRIPGMLMNFVVSEYERFALLAEAAGFDGIEIPLSDGSLLHNFLSKATNHRHDTFGGTEVSKRFEIANRVLSSIKSSLKRPDDFTIGVRLCVHDLKHDGNTMEDTLEIAEAVAKTGVVELITTSVGMHDSPVLTMGSFVPPATFAPAVKQVRDHLHKVCGITHIPIAASHNVGDPKVAEELLTNETCDLVLVGRSLLADPKFVSNVKADAEEQTIPCIGCQHCVDKLYKHQRVTCAVNPLANYEIDNAIIPSPFKKKIAVVGAGPAGITCALTARARGHEVVLFEKEPYIGGQLNYAKVIPGKERYYNLLEYWVRRLRESDIHIRFGTEFGNEDVARLSNRFDSIVMANGSIFRQPNSSFCPGTTDCPILATIPDILSRRVVAGRRVAILGNGAHAYDLASYLVHDHKVSRTAKDYRRQFGVNVEEGTLEHPEDLSWDTQRNNREVVVFERPEHDPDFARGKGWFIKQWAKQHKIDTIRAAHFNFIGRKGVTFTTLMGQQMAGQSGQMFTHECDTIVYCYGMHPNFKEAAYIREWIKDGATQRGMVTHDFGIYFAGSCRDATTSLGQGEQDLLRCIHEGYDVGMKI